MRCDVERAVGTVDTESVHVDRAGGGNGEAGEDALVLARPIPQNGPCNNAGTRSDGHTE
jgi:hypothetical protein